MNTAHIALSIILSLVITISCSISDTKDFSSNSPGILKTSESIENERSELFNTILEKDSLLFQLGFNQIDISQVSLLTSSDFEFYHDEHGVTNTKAAFVGNISGLADLPFKTWRTLVSSATEVFPLYKENSQVLYGAIQNGSHEFYQQVEGEDARKTNIARFTHLWIIEEGEWKLRRVLSYDHKIPGE